MSLPAWNEALTRLLALMETGVITRDLQPPLPLPLQLLVAMNMAVVAINTMAPTRRNPLLDQISLVVSTLPEQPIA